jgi:hypothetical protein
MPFRFSSLPVALAVSILAVGAAPLVAQSLAEVARQEEARRQEIKRPAKVYTNKDLGSVPPPSAAAQTDKPATAAAPDNNAKDAQDSAKDAAKPDGGDKDSKDKAVVKDQKYWSGRMKALTAQLERDQTYSDAMQTRINTLTADFAARDDPAQRAAIGAARQKAIDELARLKKAIVDEKKAITDLEDEARRASVPPGWLR